MSLSFYDFMILRLCDVVILRVCRVDVFSILCFCDVVILRCCDFVILVVFGEPPAGYGGTGRPTYLYRLLLQ